MLEIILSVLTVIAILALIAWLVMQPQSKVLKISLPLFIVSFVLIYAIYLAASLQPGDPLFSVAGAMKAFVESYQSVASGIDYSSLAESPALQGVVGTIGFEMFFWFLHMLLFAMLTVSGFAVLGRKMMDMARVRLARLFGKADVYHIFGQSEGALQLGRNIAKEDPKALVVYYSEEYSESLREEISAFGGALIEISEESKPKYLDRAKREHPTKVAAFSGLHGEMVNGDKVSDLLARKTVRDHAPYKTMEVRGGCPEDAYEALVIGFGDLGRACTRWLIENAQLNLNGKKPRIHIVGKNDIVFQRFMIENPGIGNCAELDFLKADAYSWEFRDYLVDLLAPLAIVPKMFICVSPVDAQTSQELEVYRDHDRRVKRHIEDILKRQGLFEPGIVFAPSLENEDLWTPEIILHQRLDKLAIAMNGKYSISGKELGEEEREEAYLSAWSTTSDFHKDSSRASCDFLPAMLALAGIDPEEEGATERFAALLEEKCDLLNMLARVEHNRWSAFHYVNGYIPMSFDEFSARVDEYVQLDEDERRSRKPQQNLDAKEHVCLASWEQLPYLDAIYARYDKKIADGSTTLQGRDCDNVMFLAELQ